MLNQLTLSTCVLIILNYQKVQSFRLYQLNDLTEGEFVKHLQTLVKAHEKPQQINVLNIIEGDLNNDRKNNVNVRTRKYGNRHLEDGFKNPILVKRKIPHGYKMGEYEYDTKLGTIYRPLIRVHVKKPMSEVEKDVMNSKPANRNTVLIVLIKNRNSPKNDFVQQIKKVINKKKYATSKEDGLRSIFAKSGEIHDPLAPGNYQAYNEVNLVTQPPTPLPEFPFWNFWTYDKTVHMDDCPGKQLKVGNFCMGMINR